MWLSEDYTRAAPGGTGAVKCGGNYAAAFVAQQQAVDNGCDQVVWLDAAEHQWVEEMGGMNLYFVHGSGAGARIMTPALTGTLLPGITRDSLLKLAPTLGIQADEGRISVPDWRAGLRRRRDHRGVRLRHRGRDHPRRRRRRRRRAAGRSATATPGPVTMRLREELIGIQYGHQPDPFGWVHKVA